MSEETKEMPIQDAGELDTGPEPRELPQTPDPIQTLLYHDNVLSEVCKDIYAIRSQIDEIKEVVGSMAAYLMEQEAKQFEKPGQVVDVEAEVVQEPKSE